MLTGGDRTDGSRNRGVSAEGSPLAILAPRPAPLGREANPTGLYNAHNRFSSLLDELSLSHAVVVAPEGSAPCLSCCVWLCFQLTDGRPPVILIGREYWRGLLDGCARCGRLPW